MLAELGLGERGLDLFLSASTWVSQSQLKLGLEQSSTFLARQLF